MPALTDFLPSQQPHSAHESAMTTLYRAALGAGLQPAHYLQRFDHFDTLGRTPPGWNWAASLCTLSWMALRHLWTAALIYVAAAEGLGLLLFGAVRSFLPWPEPVQWGLVGAFALLAFALPGLYGDAILYAEIRKRIARALASTHTLPEACAQLQRQAASPRRLTGLVAINALLLACAVLAYLYLPDSLSTASAPALAPAPAATALPAAATASTAAAPASESVVPSPAAASAPASSAMPRIPSPDSHPGPTAPSPTPESPASAAPPQPTPTATTHPAQTPNLPAAAASKASALPKASAPSTAAARPAPAAPASTTAPGKKTPAPTPPPAKTATSAATPVAKPSATRTHSASATPATPSAPPTASTPEPPTANTPTETSSQPASAPATPVPAAEATPTLPPPGNGTSTAATTDSAPAPSTAASQASSGTPTVGSAPGHYINVGLFAEEANARKAQAKLLNAGLPAFRQNVGSPQTPRIRLRVGPYPTAAQAQQAARSIKAMGLEAVVFQQK